MASDILIYNADFAPVGEDQIPILSLHARCQEDLISYMETYSRNHSPCYKEQAGTGNRRKKMSKATEIIDLIESPMK